MYLFHTILKVVIFFQFKLCFNFFCLSQVISYLFDSKKILRELFFYLIGVSPFEILLGASYFDKDKYTSHYKYTISL